MRTSLIVVSIVTFATALSGCHVEERDAPKSSVAAPELGYFPVTSRVTLQNNRLFLWRDGVTGGQARTVMESGQYLDDLEAELMEISTTASRGEDGVPRYDEGQQARIQEIDSITETLIFAVMENTDLYPNQPSRVSFFPDGGGYGITISNWEYQNYSSVAGDVDDPPAALGAHDRHHGLAGEERRCDVHADHRIELGAGVVAEVVWRTDAGVVHQHVDAAEPLVRVGDHCLGVAGDGKIVEAVLDRAGIRIGPALGLCRLELFLRAFGDEEHRGAGCCEALCDRVADAVLRGCAGDDAEPALHRCHGASGFSWLR